jgi:hypothetical protein
VILEIVFLICLILWGLSVIPHPQITPYIWAGHILAFICVLILGLRVFGLH